MKPLKKSQSHAIDVVFAMVLLCVFAVTVLMVLITGAKVYRGISARMKTHYTQTTAVSYIVQKVRHYDAAGAVSVGDFDGNNALLLSEQINGVSYTTVIYYYGGAVRELFTETGNSLPADSGFEIVRADGASFALDGGLLKIACGTPESAVTLSLRSAAREEQP